MFYSSQPSMFVDVVLVLAVVVVVGDFVAVA